MRTFISLVLCSLSLTIALGLQAVQPAPAQLAGNWKLSFLLDKPGQLLTLGLLKLEVKDGQLAATLDAAPETPKVSVPAQGVVLAGDQLSVNLDMEGTILKMSFKVAKGDVKQLRGTISVPGSAFPAILETTKDQSAKDYKGETTVPLPKGGFKELKEYIAQNPNDIGVLAAAHRVLQAAASDKVPVAGLKAALEPVFRTAREYGVWYRDFALSFARDFASRPEYAVLGEELARQGLTDLAADADTTTKLRYLDLIATSLHTQNKKAELATVQARIDEMELKGHVENEKEGLGFVPVKFAGRKGNRTVLVELFTGAQCPPCVAADLAFEGLAKTYAPADVMLLQYHLHIPGPDPMTTADSEERAKYYGDDVRGTPSIFFNGKSAAGGGGFRQHAPEKYKEYCGVINPLLEGESKVAVTLEAKRLGDAISITAGAKGYKASDKMKLRLALIEPWVRYAGRNGLSYHAHVVRALPGGPAGFTLSKDSAKETVRVDLGVLRQSSDKFLSEIEFLNGQRPFAFRNLQLVAFVQNDETKEILHSIEVVVR